MEPVYYAAELDMSYIEWYNKICKKEDDMEFKGYDLAKIVNQENGFTVMLGARHYVFNSWNDMVEFLNEEFNPFEEEE